MMPRKEAWRELYSRLLVEQLEADVHRLVAVEARSRKGLAETFEPDFGQRLYDRRAAKGDPVAEEALTEEGQREVQEVWECAVDLCELALAMVRQSGAADDEPTRRRFLAGLRHANTADVFRGIPSIVKGSADRLITDLDLNLNGLNDE
jgi:hypothetical protein